MTENRIGKLKIKFKVEIKKGEDKEVFNFSMDKEDEE